jgi:hypothetical protein
MKRIDIIKTGILLLMTAVFVAGCNNDETEKNPFTGKDNYIAAFALVKDGVTLKGAISSETIIITVPERFSLSGATASIVLSENATIEPDPATITDWDAAQTFTITAYNGSKHMYAYSVERHLVSRDGDVVLLTQADIEAFTSGLDADQINGTLTVGATSGQDSVYNLVGLEQLRVIIGGIVINATYAGETLVFENLEKTGALTISSKTVKTVSFPKLAIVRLDFNLDQPSSVTSLNFPELSIVDKAMKITYANSLRNIRFPKLQHVREGLTVQENYSASMLRTLEFPALNKIDGNIYLYNLRKLEAVNFPELTCVGAILLSRLDSARYFTAPKLETIGGELNLNDCHEITELTFPTLKTLNGNLSLYTNKLEYLSCPLLEKVRGDISSQLPSNPEIKFPSLKIINGNVMVGGSTSLATFPALDSVGSINVSYGDYEATFDLRGIKTSLINFYATGKITLIGDDVFPGTLENMNSCTLIIKEGFKTINRYRMTNALFETADFSWMEHVKEDIEISNLSLAEVLVFPNLRSVGRVNIVTSYINDKLKAFSMPNLTTITGYTDTWGATRGGFTFTLYSSNITSVELPKLENVVGDVSINGFTATRTIETISFPTLKSLTGTLTISGTNNAVFKDLSGFSSLTTASGVVITSFTELKDFSPLQNVIPSLSADTWKITGCGYNPGYQDMLDGKYVQP